MKLGKKLYFNSEGKCIKEVGEMQGNIHPSTIEQDFHGNIQAYSDLIQLEYGQQEYINYGSIWLFNNELVIYPKIQINSDKETIISDGVEFAIIQVTTQSIHNETITLSIPELNESVNIDIINGVGEFEFSSEIEGEYMLCIEHELYSNCSIIIKVV